MIYDYKIVKQNMLINGEEKFVYQVVKLKHLKRWQYAQLDDKFGIWVPFKDCQPLKPDKGTKSINLAFPQDLD